jgi:uncharacterized membrane protein (DUF4010 family)
VRTFLLLGLLGGMAGWLFAGELTAAGALVLASGAALTVVAYGMAARAGGERIEGTTEVAALLVLALGVASGLGFPLLSSAIASVMVLALIEKTRIHAAIQRLGETEFAAALQFAALALVVLPILPAGPYGPFDSVRPRAIWAAVLLFSGLNFAGYVARRVAGMNRGYQLTGLLGGMVSSTAVTLSFARKSRAEPAAGQALAIGVLGACTALVVRVAIVASILNPAVGIRVIPYVVPIALIGVVVLWLALRGDRSETPRGPEPEERSPLGLWAAVKMAVAFQLVLIAVPYLQHLWGSRGVWASAVVLGVTDMDALTYAMTRLGSDVPSAALAAQAMAVGILASTVFKVLVTLTFGSGTFRRLATGGLLALGGASGVGLWMFGQGK